MWSVRKWSVLCGKSGPRAQEGSREPRGWEVDEQMGRWVSSASHSPRADFGCAPSVPAKASDPHDQGPWFCSDTPLPVAHKSQEYFFEGVP